MGRSSGSSGATPIAVSAGGPDTGRRLIPGRSGQGAVLCNAGRSGTGSRAKFELPDDPELPAVLMRQAGEWDNWRPLVAIADLAGGQWPALARQAALEAAVAEKKQSRLERLLAAIRRDLTGSPTPRRPTRRKPRPPALEDADQCASGRHRKRLGDREPRPRDHRGVAGEPREMLDPAGAQQWFHGSPRMHARGYSRLQFRDAWRRYTPAQGDEKTYIPSPLFIRCNRFNRFIRFNLPRAEVARRRRHKGLIPLDNAEAAG